MSLSDRTPERRQANLGGPSGRERRALADRRGMNNALYVRFGVGGVDFLLAVEDVQEVVSSPAPVPVPLAPPAVTGLINLRGRILAAVDLRVLQGDAAGAPAGLGVVACPGPEAFLVLADEVYDVIDLSPTMLKPAPANLSGPTRALTRAVCQLPDALLIVLEPAAIRRLIEPGAADGLLA